MREENIFSPFPIGNDHYSPDVAPIVDYTVARYGLTEWRAAVLTNELHGHLGIYSTIGVKMGIFAREILQQPHHIKVISFAGSKPPLSCMNDGLQVSTGATIGHGLISIADDTNTRAEAIFFADDREICIRLREDDARQIAADIRQGIEQFGKRSPKYWSYIRHLAIDYWQAFDREEIFEVVSAR